MVVVLLELVVEEVVVVCVVHELVEVEEEALLQVCWLLVVYLVLVLVCWELVDALVFAC